MTNRELDEETIFHTARLIDQPEARQQYLNQICAGDQALRERVDALLAVHERERSFLKSNGDQGLTVDQPEIQACPGQQIGRYKLLQKIGEGGFGVVYMAEQQRPVRRKVALKIIKPGMDTRAVVARFEAERQALAMMDDPNIARVFDGGATEGGRPYFVMELVRGLPITEYCDKNQLSMDERLRLFKTVCEAVQHAHQKGIIHRDLKPSNVLVTLADGRPIVKVIDFGVAKATNQQLTEKTLFTAFGQMVGTPQYMSPEQAEMSCLDVDTRSDVYSLGILLYELLTGTTPLQSERLRTAGFAEMQRLIREEEPPKPSTRLSTAGEKLTVLAKHRNVSPEKLKSQVRGDLDWIVMKALEKDRSRRYESPNSLARDVCHYLENQPIDARPPTFRYQTVKYLKRNRVPVTVAGLLIATLTAGLFVITFSARRVQRLLKELASQKQALMTDTMTQTTVFALQGDLSDARKKLQAAHRLGAKIEWVKLREGQIALQDGEYEQARLLLHEAQALLPKSTVAKSLSIIADEFAGFEHAYWLGVGELKNWPASQFEEYLFRGLAQTWAHPKLAVEDLEQALARNTNNAVVHLLLGRALRLLAVDTTDPHRAYEIAKRSATKTFVAREMLVDNSLATAEYIHARIVLANACKRLGDEFDEEQQACVSQARAAIDQSRTMPYHAMVHAARCYFYNQFGTRKEEANELFTDVPANLGEKEDQTDVVFRRSWMKFRDDEPVLARKELNSMRGSFAYRTNITFPAVIDMTSSSGDDLEALQQKYAVQLKDPDRDGQGIFAHQDWAVARLLKMDAVAKSRGKAFRDLCETIPLDFAVQYEPVAAYMTGELDSTAAETRLRQLATSNRVLAESFFALGVGRLADGERSEAKRLFEACLSTGYYQFFVYWWSQAFLERLGNEHWLSWLVSATETNVITREQP